MRIRRATAADAPAIAAVLREAFAEYAPLYTSAALAATTPPAEHIAARLKEGPTWVAVLDERIVGTVSAEPCGRVVYIRSMGVVDAARGHGLGAALLDRAAGFADVCGAEELLLSTTPFLNRALRLYQSYGFKRSDAGPHDLHGTPLLSMTRPIQKRGYQSMQTTTATKFTLRRATSGDLRWLVRHRCEMFRDMGKLRDDAYPQMEALSRAYFAEAVPAGDYIAWLVTPESRPELIVSGGGMLLRQVPPGIDGRGGVRPDGPQGLVMNVYTEPEWRGHGLATMLMETIIAWAKANGVASLILHASEMGRPIYEKLGFAASNEMYFPYDRLLSRE